MDLKIINQKHNKQFIEINNLLNLIIDMHATTPL